MHYLSVVIPAYNEEKKISKDIKEAYKYFSENNINGEVIVIDDGSKDQTFNTAKNLSSKYPSLKVINYGKNKGKGYAIKTGILQATREYILLVDSGLCVPFKFANHGLDLLKKGNDIAIGSRKTNAKIIISQPLYRRLGSKLFHTIIKIFKIIPEGIEDTQCGFKLFKKDVAHNVFRKIFTEKFMWDIEMLRRASKEKYKIAAFPVEWSNDADTKFHPYIGSIENLLQIINIMFRT